MKKEDDIPEVKDIECRKLNFFERNNYFYGKLLTASDFKAEQRYFVEKLRLANRLLHGFGVVCGLKVLKGMLEDSKIRITEGVAIDCCGREIVVPEFVEVDFANGVAKDCNGKEIELDMPEAIPKDGDVYILLKYYSRGVKPVPNIMETSGCEEICCYGRILESYKIEIKSELSESPSDTPEAKICEDWNKFIADLDCYEFKDCSVLLAKVKLSDGKVVHVEDMRKHVYSNFVLYEFAECLREEIEVVEEELEKLRKEVTDLGDGLKTLKEEVEKRMEKIEEELKKLKKELGELREATEKLKEEIETLKKELEELKKIIEKDLPKISRISWEHNKEYGLNGIDEFRKVCREFKITFDRAMDKSTINHKTLSLTYVRYEFESGELGYVEKIIEKREVPIYFKDSPENEVVFSPVETSMAATTTTTVTTAVAEHGLSASYALSNAIELKRNIGIRLIIQLKGDFVLDSKGKCLDGNFLKGKLPTGNGCEGGLFESWFDLKIGYSEIDRIRRVVIEKGVSPAEIAEKVKISENIVRLVLNTLVEKKAIYREEDKYYPILSSKEVIVAYDGRYTYLEKLAEKMAKELEKKGIRAEIKSSGKLTEEDLSKEIILVRGREVRETTEKIGIPSTVDWSKSVGDIEVAKHPVTASKIVVVGGKDKKSVDSAIGKFLESLVL